MNAVMREPRPVAVECVYKVRNIQAESFEQAKEVAADHVARSSVRKFGLSPFAAREADGSYTVEFR
jgi:hypothetical protein